MGGAKDAHIYGESDGHRCRRCHKLLPPIPPLHRETFLLPAKEWRNQSLSNLHYNVILYDLYDLDDLDDLYDLDDLDDLDDLYDFSSFILDGGYLGSSRII